MLRGCDVSRSHTIHGTVDSALASHSTHLALIGARSGVDRGSGTGILVGHSSVVNGFDFTRFFCYLSQFVPKLRIFISCPISVEVR